MNSDYIFYPLEWDTDYFKIKCAKLILCGEISESDCADIKKKLENYELIYIENINNKIENNKKIAKTDAYLADVGVELSKTINGTQTEDKHIHIENNFKGNNEIYEITENVFNCSRFILDNELSSRGGPHIYSEWVKSSLNKPDKYFVLCHGGFLLFSLVNNAGRIELIGVENMEKRRGIGGRLLAAMEQWLYEHDINTVNVGTQANNIRAVNFYNKNGYRQTRIKTVYHLWRK